MGQGGPDPMGTVTSEGAEVFNDWGIVRVSCYSRMCGKRPVATGALRWINT